MDRLVRGCLWVATLGLVVTVWPAAVSATPACEPDSWEMNVTSSPDPGCVEVTETSFPRWYGDSSDEMLEVRNGCDEVVRFRTASCQFVDCSEEGGCPDIECDGEWLEVDPGTSMEVGDVGDGDAAMAPDGSADTTQTDGDTGETSVGDAGGGETSDTTDGGDGGMDAVGGDADGGGSPDPTVESFETGDLGLSSEMTDGTDGDIEMSFDWELGETQEGVFDGVLEFEPGNSSCGGTPVGCFCSAPADNPLEGLDFLALGLVLAGLSLLRRRRP